MIRTLHSELVDDLPSDHPGALRSRRDLQRLNAIMGHAGILAREIERNVPKKASLNVVEIGAGGGELLLRLARRLRGRWQRVEATLIDLHDLVTDERRADFEALNWQIRLMQKDVFQWIEPLKTSHIDVVLANLVLHHFSDEELRKLFRTAAANANAFIALEPRRSKWPLFCTRWLSLIGCGSVTCHDAPVSVRAGFVGNELSSLWPRDENWQLTERRAGLFSHLFVAKRKA